MRFLVYSLVLISYTASFAMAQEPWQQWKPNDYFTNETYLNSAHELGKVYADMAAHGELGMIVPSAADFDREIAELLGTPQWVSLTIPGHHVVDEFGKWRFETDYFGSGGYDPVEFGFPARTTWPSTASPATTDSNQLIYGTRRDPGFYYSRNESPHPFIVP